MVGDLYSRKWLFDPKFPRNILLPSKIKTMTHPEHLEHFNSNGTEYRLGSALSRFLKLQIEQMIIKDRVAAGAVAVANEPNSHLAKNLYLDALETQIEINTALEQSRLLIQLLYSD